MYSAGFTKIHTYYFNSNLSQILLHVLAHLCCKKFLPDFKRATKVENSPENAFCNRKWKKQQEGEKTEILNVFQGPLKCKM